MDELWSEEIWTQYNLDSCTWSLLWWVFPKPEMIKKFTHDWVQYTMRSIYRNSMIKSSRHLTLIISTSWSTLLSPGNRGCMTAHQHLLEAMWNAHRWMWFKMKHQISSNGQYRMHLPSSPDGNKRPWFVCWMQKIAIE